MKIAKAIEISRTYIVTRNATLDPDVKESIRLGIEAMKRIQKLRLIRLFGYDTSLAGETKE